MCALLLFPHSLYRLSTSCPCILHSLRYEQGPLLERNGTAHLAFASPLRTLQEVILATGCLDQGGGGHGEENTSAGYRDRECSLCHPAPACLPRSGVTPILRAVPGMR